MNHERVLVIALLTALIASAVLIVGAPPVAAAVGPKTITVDGNPSDWTGIAGAANTGLESLAEFVWNDAASDDTGDGDYTYPTNLESPGPPPVPTFPPGIFDIRELRITADATNLYLLIRVGDLTHPPSWGPVPSDGFSTVAGVLLIDTTRDGAGRLTARPNVNIATGNGWEYFAKIGQTGWHAESAKIWDAAGNWAPIANKGDVANDAIEASIPLAFIGKDGYSINAATWRFMFFWQSHAGENPDGFRDVEVAAETYKFGGGAAHGFDPKIQDLAFSATLAAQVAELSSYSDTAPATISSSADVTFANVGFVPDTTAPVISSINAATTSNQAVITWTTNEIAGTTVRYGRTNPTIQTISLDEFTTSHSVTISGLVPETTYFYEVESKDIAGNVQSSPVAFLTTAAAAPSNFASWVSNWLVWQDARGDDTGDSDYVYPNEPSVSWAGRGDIWFLNMTQEGTYNHYSVRINAAPDTVWHQRMAALVMFIDQDRVPGSGATSVKFVQPESDPGHPLDIKVAREFAWEYMVLATFQNRSASSDAITGPSGYGELLIRTSTFDAGTNTYQLFYMSTLATSPNPTAARVNSSKGGTQLDFWLNRAVLGGGDNWTYVALGVLYDDAGGGWPNGGIRQVLATSQTWEGGGANGPLNPNVYDLAFYPSTPFQETDLIEYISTSTTSVTRAIQVNLQEQWYALLSVQDVLGMSARISDTSIAAGETSGLALVVTNRNAPVEGASVLLAASPATAVTIGAPNPTSTDPFGVATFAIRGNVVSADTTVTLTATATVGGKTVSSAVGVSVLAPVVTHTYRVHLAATGTSLNTGAQATVTATFTDKGLPISGASVSLVSNNAALAVVASPTTTNAQGLATFAVRAGFTTSDVVATLTATATNATVQTTATLSVTVKAFVHVYSVAGAASAAVVAPNETTTVTFTFTDAGAAREGVTIAISLSPANAFDVVGDVSKATDANGRAVFTLRARTLDSDTAAVVTASATNGTAANVASATVTLVAQAPAPTIPPQEGVSTGVFVGTSAVLLIAAIAFAALWAASRRRRPPEGEGAGGGGGGAEGEKGS